MVIRARHLLLTSLLLLVSVLSCTDILGIDTDYRENACNAPNADQLDPIVCYKDQGECHAIVDACDSLGLPASCPPKSPKDKDQCNDSLDNDCDGQVDEDECVCGETPDSPTSKPCYKGSVATRNVGVCRDGVQICELNQWGQCDGSVNPEKEICDQLDNDCDGQIDEACPCQNGATQNCYGGDPSTIGIGICKQGLQTCINGSWGDCVGDETPRAVELCDGDDSNCNGQSDSEELGDDVCECVEGETIPCYTGPDATQNVGVCRDGHHECVDGKYDRSECVDEVLPAAEECNGLDDDCDGYDDTDEALPGVGVACETNQQGICKFGEQGCTSGGLQCIANFNPNDVPEEITPCNNEDDDCDGSVDNGIFCCPDGTKNGNETSIDCGGSCLDGCPDGAPCMIGSDCESGVCQSSSCVPPTCTDGVKNGDEGDDDCGGPCVDCPVGSTCNVFTDCETQLCIQGVCTALGIGELCTANDQCATNYCVDGRCCDGPCTGLCVACSTLLKGFGANGVCGPIIAGQDPEDECALQGAATCGTTGVCNGAGSCQLYPSSTVCAAALCIPGGSSSQPTRYCDGQQASCLPSIPVDCSPYACNPGTGICRTICGGDTECAGGYYCNAGQCLPEKPNGQACVNSNECQTGYCVDGFCCESLCDGTCESCRGSYTGLPNGQCQPILAGTDPGNECNDVGASSCSFNGQCNGARDCALYSSGTVCAPAACVGDTALDQADTCSGQGVCLSQGNVSCGAYRCNPALSVCRTSCQVTAECADGYYCSANVCLQKRPLGVQCGAGVECASSFCVDGVCCETDCVGACQACTAQKKGSGQDGYCGAVAVATDPDNECLEQPESTCQQNGLCNGLGACQRWPSGTVCSTAQCSNDAVTLFKQDICDGSGNCIDGGTQSCAPYSCAAAACTILKIDGTPCSIGSECVSGYCVDSVCCETACTGTCSACTAAKKSGGLDGDCGPVAAGLDPDSECTQQPASTCGFNGQCDGAGACQLHAQGVDCGTDSCVNGSTWKPANECDGAGTCVNSAAVSCAPFTCAGNTCTNLKDIGIPCGQSSECASGSCVDGVCCTTACSGPCQACTAQKKGSGLDGYCDNIAAGADPDLECADTGAASCGTTGVCSGAGTCQLYAGGTSCAPASCDNNGVTRFPADLCNGGGTCVDSGSVSCAPFTCANGACTTKRIIGASCTLNADCDSNFCADGVCCNNSCAGSCEACTQSKKGGGLDGFCGPVAVGSDPDNECDVDPVASCDRDGMCDGVGACRLHAAGTQCQAGSCAGDNVTKNNPDVCDGSGSCVDGGTMSCGVNTCENGNCTNELINGQPCSANPDCASNFCVDGVCCGTQCNGTCEACTNFKKGAGVDGVCGPVLAGQDPDNDCDPEAASTCGRDGQCNGAGACRLHASGTQCTAAACAGPSTANPPDQCNGSGTCAPTANVDCGLFVCDSGTGACRPTCTNDSHCAGGAYCEGNQCADQKDPGQPCQNGNECALGFCVDGFCCDTTCNGSCQACSATKKGSGANGACGAIAAGTDPDSECTQDLVSTCDQDGMCNGSGACRLWANGTPCSDGICVDGSTENPADECDGSGQCVPTSNQSCGLFACDVPTGECLSSCVDDSDCVGTAYCAAPTCALKQALGAACSGNNQCESNFCVDNVCCEDACNGPCQACSAAKKIGGLQDGLCGFIPAGVDHDDECVTAPQSSCGQDGMCNGSGSCRLYTVGTTCTVPICLDQTTVDPANECDGAGACVDVPASDCGFFACDDAITDCLTTCADDLDCAPTAYCDATACTPKLAQGAPCSADNQCATGSCADDVCCDAACSGTCDSCTAALKGAGVDGECGPTAMGVICSAASCAADGVTLHNDDTCDGAGACVDGGTTSCQLFACIGGACEPSCTTDAECAPGAYCSASVCRKDVVLMLGGGGSPRGASFYPGEGWTSTAIAGGSTSDRFALAMDATRGMGLIRQTGGSGNNDLLYTSWDPATAGWSSWAAVNTTYDTNAKPAIAAFNGTAHAGYLYDTGTDVYRYAVFNGSWSGFESIGVSPSVIMGGDIAVLGAGGGTAAFVYTNGTTLRYTQRNAGSWSAAIDLDSPVHGTIPPTLVSMIDGTRDLMAVFVRNTNRINFRTRNATTGVWSASTVIGGSTVTTMDQVALAALPGGSAVLAYRSSAASSVGRIFTSFFNGSWSTPVEFSSTITIAGAPAVTRGVGAGTPNAAFVELGYVLGATATMQHVRCTAMTGGVCSAWSAPVEVSASTVSNIAIASAP